jgi:hypothetical protein
MTKLSTTDLERQTWIKGEYIAYWGMIWSALALILYLNFSVVEPGTARSTWFILTTMGFEEIGLLVAGLLCWRNWRSDYIPNGRAVWLLFAIAMFAFFIGNLCFSLWELIWGLDPAASVGNPFFVLFYLMLIGGVRLAMLDRDVRLARQQWVAVVSIATCGLVIGCWLTTVSARAELSTAPPPLVIDRQAEFQQPDSLMLGTRKPLTLAPALPTIGSPAHPQQPSWVLAVDRWMQPLVSTFNLFYVLCDLILLVFAAILLLGFWGGHMGLPWRMTAQAVLCFYIADTWFAYANNQVQGYQSGSIMEVFWVFGIVQFGIAAALEFDNSIRARRLARRRTAIK